MAMMTPTRTVEKYMLCGPLTGRYVVSCLAGVAVAGPLGARAQQPEPMRRIAWFGLGRADVTILPTAGSCLRSKNTEQNHAGQHR
jgi:hypothetical protein